MQRNSLKSSHKENDHTPGGYEKVVFRIYNIFIYVFYINHVCRTFEQEYIETRVCPHGIHITPSHISYVDAV